MADTQIFVTLISLLTSLSGSAVQSFRPVVEEELTGHVHNTGDQFFFIVGDLFELWQAHKELQEHILIFRQVGQLDQTRKWCRTWVDAAADKRRERCYEYGNVFGMEKNMFKILYFMSQSSGKDSGISGILYKCPFSPT